MTSDEIVTEARAEKLRAEARKAAAEALTQEIAAVTAAIELEREQHKRAKERATDEHHHVYRFGGAVDTGSVKACMERLAFWSRQAPGCDIEIVLSSPGGSVIDGFVLFDFVRSLSRAGHRITTGCLGMAASMAGVLLQMGDHRWVGREGWVMIHRAAFGAYGKSYEVEDEVEWVKRIERRIISIFVSRSGGRLTERKIRRNWERRDWWLSSDEALELGIVDEIR